MKKPALRELHPDVEVYLRWLIALRIVVFVTLMVATLIFQTSSIDQDIENRSHLGLLEFNYLYDLTAATLTLSLLYIALRGWLRRPLLEAAIQLGGDLLVITALIYFTRGVESPFSFLYIISISTAAVLLYRRGAVLTASAANILYGTLVALMVHGIVPVPGHVGVPAFAIWSPGKVYYNIFVNLIGFYAAAALTSYLAEKLRTTRAELDTRKGELLRLQAFSSEVVAGLGSGLLTFDNEHRITFLNPAGAIILGVHGPDLIGCPIESSDLLNERPIEEILETVNKDNRANLAVLISQTNDAREIRATVSRLTDGSGLGLGHIVLFEDVTEFRELERQLRVRDQMAAVGEMAAGIAHEIRNPLAAIAGSVQVLRGEDGLSEEGQTLSEIVLTESQRLNRIIEDFIRFVRPPIRAAENYDVASDLADTLRMLRNSAEVLPSHQIEFSIEPDSFFISADAGQIRQVIWNVARNGLRAMPDGGDLHLEGRPSQDSYLITVSDTGCGMSSEEISRLFQPFTTRFDGGSGLGMSIVYRIVEEHDGRIQVESQPGLGTTIRIELPLEPPT